MFRDLVMGKRKLEKRSMVNNDLIGREMSPGGLVSNDMIDSDSLD